MGKSSLGVRLAKAAIGLWLGSGICFAAPSCPKLASANSAALVDYLQNDRSALEPPCIEFAIARLGERAYVPAADVLTSYLDFKIPIPNPSHYSHGIQWMPEYPAARALSSIGLSATASLIKAIGSGASSPLLRSNATDVFEVIDRANNATETVAILYRASQSAADGGARGWLFDAALRVANHCHPDLRAACLNELK